MTLFQNGLLQQIFYLGFWYILVFLITLSVIIFVHEFGHFWVARRAGVRVEVFSIGFGPELFGWNDRYGTRWCISLLPLGGYVKMFGFSDVAETKALAVAKEEQHLSFIHKTVAWRSAIAAAGPIANFLFAIFALSLVYATVGKPQQLEDVSPRLAQILPGKPAAVAGLQPDDIITAVNDRKVTSFAEVVSIIKELPGEEILLSLVRNGIELEVRVTLGSREVVENGIERNIGELGVVSNANYELVRLGPFAAVSAGVAMTWETSVRTLEAIGEILTGKRSSKELGGVIKIAEIIGGSAQDGLGSLIFFSAILSINLGLLNLFPIPVLDGGRLLFYGIEAVLGRPLNERIQEISSMIGLAVIAFLIVFVNWNDFSSLIWNH